MNWDKIEQLLNIYHHTLHMPELGSIHQGAHKELLEHAKPPAPAPVSVPKVEPKAEEPAHKGAKF